MYSCNFANVKNTTNTTNKMNEQSMLSLIETRNRHFLEACRRIIDSLPAGAHISLPEIAAKAAASPAPHYYCTFTYALRMLRLLRHGRLPLRNDRRRMMWEELNVKTAIVMARRGCRLPEALADVLASHSASRFFISSETALSLVYRLSSRA